MTWFLTRKRLRARVLDLEDDLRRLNDRVGELDDKLRRYMGRENQRLRREVSPETSTPDSSPGPMNGEDYMAWVNDPISRRIRHERAQSRAMAKRRNEASDTTDRATSSETSSEPSPTSLIPPLPGWLP